MQIQLLGGSSCNHILYIQSIGQDTFSSASLIYRFRHNDNAAVNVTAHGLLPAISNKAQVPSRRISSDLMGKVVTTGNLLFAINIAVLEDDTEVRKCVLMIREFMASDNTVFGNKIKNI